MTRTLSGPQLERLNEFVADRFGLYFPPERLSDLKRGILSAASEMHFTSAGSFIDRLLSSPLSKKQIEVLAGHLTVGETYFYRDSPAFEALEKHVLPSLVRGREKSGKYLRIWCAGCCTGEEAYSLAIAVSRAVPDLKNWNITILATDINPRFLRKALKGHYGKRSFRGCPSWIREGYFVETGDGFFQLCTSIKRMVSFAYLNLAEGTYPSTLNDTNAMDLIFCRNVLMYFKPDRARKVVQGLYRAMAQNGWIFVSPCEASLYLFHQFEMETKKGTILYRKGRGRPRPSVSFVPQVAVEPPGSTKAAAPAPAVAAHTLLRKPAITEPSQTEEQPSLEAQKLFKEGQYKDAARILEDLMAGDEPKSRKSPELIALLARIYANQGELARSRQWCEKAVAADRLDPGLHYLRAAVLQEQGLADEAIASLKRALQLDRSFVLAHFCLGNIARNKGKLEEARRHFKIALSILKAYTEEEVVPLSGGMSAACLRQALELALQGEEGS